MALAFGQVIAEGAVLAGNVRREMKSERTCIQCRANQRRDEGLVPGVPREGQAANTGAEKLEQIIAETLDLPDAIGGRNHCQTGSNRPPPRISTWPDSTNRRRRSR